MGRGRAVLFVGVIWFLSVGVLTQMTARSRVVSKENYDSIGRGRHHMHQDSDFHFVIKKKVPNGPDPIHNRGAALSRKPPGQT